MFTTLLAKVIGTKSERELKRMAPMVRAINDLEPQVQKLTDAELRAKTDEFRKRHTEGESLDDLLLAAFAVCREAGRRALNMRHFDVQLIGGIVLYQGKIAEMLGECAVPAAAPSSTGGAVSSSRVMSRLHVRPEPCPSTFAQGTPSTPRGGP